MTYTITDLANEFGVTHRTLRFYEEKGLIDPERKGQARLYSKRDRARLLLILRGRDLGLTLYEIRQILDLYRNGKDVEEQNLLAVSFFKNRLAAAKAQRARVDRQIESLEEACQRFEGRTIVASHPRHDGQALRTGTH